MRVVIDANIIFSLLLSGSGKFHNILFDDSLKLSAPNFVFVELFKHKEKIKKFTKISEDELIELLGAITDRISFFPVSNIREDNLRNAVDICKNVDEKDIPYVALAIELDAALMTGDSKLRRHLKLKHPQIKLYNY
jgi:putative PIN family toxin of toxin-antitoxin system